MKTLSRICTLVCLILLSAETVVAQQPVMADSQPTDSQHLTALGQMADHYTRVETYWFNMRTNAWGYAVNQEDQDLPGSHPNYSSDQYSEHPVYFVSH